METINCEVCGGVLLEQTIWYNDDVGYIVYYVCSRCGHIHVDDKYRDRVMMIEEVWDYD